MALFNDKKLEVHELPKVLALDCAGNPIRWIDYERSVYYYAKDLIAWEIPAPDFTLYGGNSRMSGERSTITMNTIIALKGKISKKALKQNLRVPLSNDTLFQRDQNICGYCGKHFTKKMLTRDHIMPASRNGGDTWLNLVTACAPCNHAKKDKTPEEAHMKLLYVPYVPTKNEFLILSNRRILADQMEFLMKNVPTHSRLHQN